MTHLRVARPTDDLDKVSHMYRDGLDFEILGKFKDHDGFDGVILGKWNLGCHLEFTHQAGHSAGRAPTKDNLLVFYYPGRETWRRICKKMAEAGFRTVASWNPYWNAKGRTFEDPDGYRVVIQNDVEPFRGGSDRREEGELAL